MSNANQVGVRDFHPKTIRSLAKKGIRIIGICAIPDNNHPMPYANATRGYQLDDNGTGRIRTRLEVVMLADNVK